MAKYIGIIFMATTCLLLTVTLGQLDEEVCLRKTITGPPPDAVQGRPGKSGAPGPPGPKGSQGETGGCGCDPSEITQLNRRIEELKNALQLMDEKLTTVTNFTSVLRKGSAFKVCSVGLRDGRVRDADITASTIHDSNHAAHQARLDYKGQRSPFLSDGWAAGTLSAGQWIQVDLRKSTFVTGVVTQGRFDADQWVTSYKITFGNSVTSLKTMLNNDGTEKVFTGNYDRNSYVIHRFDKPVTARYFRVIAMTWHNHISLRHDYFSC